MKKLIITIIILATAFSSIGWNNLVWELEAVKLNTEVERLQQQNHDLEIIIESLKKQQTSSLVKTAQLKTNAKVVRGTASVYSEDGCLGCDKNLIMANGQRLDDDVPTVAVACSNVNMRCYIPFHLGTRVRVENVATGAATVATVTDTFGGVYGRVVDLSKATATAINCKGLCQVQLSLQ